GTAKTSVSWRSNSCDQTCEPFDVVTSCAVMRTRAPDLRTLPSSRFATSSFCPIERRSSFFPLSENEEVRPITRRPSTWASALRISSEMPSEKYSCSLSELRFTNGSTAIDGEDGSEADLWPRKYKYQSAPGAAAMVATRTSARR